MLKRGITFLSIMVAVVALAIITATLVISVPNVLQSSKLRAFASELMIVQTKIQSLNGNYSEYVINDIIVDISDLTDKSIFDGIITDNKVSLQQLNLEALEFENTLYGNAKTPKDIYCISPENGVVYYLAGFETPDAKYYALNSDLMNMVSSKEDLTDNVGKNIVFIPSTFVKTTEAIKVIVKVPIAATGVNITTSGNVTPAVSSATAGTNYNQYTVNTNSVKGNYTVTVKYTLNGENKTAIYNVEEYLGVYGILYSDGELRINNDGKVDKYKLESGNTVTFQSADIANSSSVPWSTYATSIKTVAFENEVTPAYITKWFQGCTNLIEVNNAEYLDTTKVTNMSYLFYNCASLVKADISNFNTQKVTNMTYMFYNCSSLKKIDVSNFNTQKVTNMNSMFRGCSSVIALDLSGFYSPKLTSMTSMFRECKNLEELNMIGFSTPNRVSLETTFYNCNKLKVLDLKGIVKISSLNATFNGCSSIKELDLSHMDSAGMQHMMNAFNGCSALETLNLTGLNTSSLIGIQKVFAGCSNLTYVDVSTWDVSKVENMNSVFSYCKKLNSIDLSNWTTSAATNMAMMFMGCSALKSLDLKNFKPANVENISQMFQRCEALTELDLSTWNITKLTSASQTFYYAKNLEYLDMRNVDFTTSTNYGNMFFGMPNGAILIVADDTQRTWLQSKISSASNLVIKTVSEL